MLAMTSLIFTGRTRRMFEKRYRTEQEVRGSFLRAEEIPMDNVAQKEEYDDGVLTATSRSCDDTVSKFDAELTRPIMTGGQL